jgi:hypothetical protein
MSDIALEKILAQVSNLSPAQKIAVCDALLATSTVDPKKVSTCENLNAAAKIDPVLAAAAASNPQLYAAIVAARGEAARIGVRVDADNRVDPIELNAALTAKGWSPEKRISAKKILSLGLMID